MIRYFAKHPTAANLLMIIMLAMGILSLGGLQRETLPDSMPEEVEVRVMFPGASTSEVDEAIVQRLEDVLEGVRYTKEMKSVARQSMGTVTLRMTDNGVYNSFRNEIDNAIASIDDLPDDAETPVITRLNTKSPVFDVLVAGPLEPNDLKSYCESLKDRLTASPNVSEIEIQGFSDRVFRIEVSREALLRFGLSPSDISRAIGDQSLDLPAGKIESEENVAVRVQESRKSRLELEDLIVKGSRGGAEVRLSDIATIVDEFELDEERIDVVGRRSAVLQVLKTKSEDTLTVADEVNEILEEERKRTPQISLTVINDQAALVQDRISLLVKNGIQGCLLVFIVMWMFFNARLSFWVVFSLPVSFLAAFALVPPLGLTINMLTMVGLLMALGLLMDDGIVIAENIARRRSQGESAMDAAVHGVQEVAGGVFSSFLTTCSVLGPLVFLSGEIGRILRVLPMMLLLVLAASLIEAFLILPAHLGHSLEHDPKKTGWLRGKLDAGIEAMRRLVTRMVGWTINWRYLTTGLVIMVFFASIGLVAGGLVRFQVFPKLEGDTIVGRILMPPGTPLERTQEVVAQLQSALVDVNKKFKPRQPDEQDLITTTYVRYSQNTDAMESGPHVATIFADLLKNEVRDAKVNEVIAEWEKRVGVIPDAISITYDEPMIGPTGRNIEIQLAGLELAELNLVSEELQTFLKTYEGVSNISDDLRKGENELLVTLRPGALGLGITTLDLARQLRGSFQGLLSDQVQVGVDSYDVEVRYRDEDRNSLEDLEDYLVTLPNEQTVPLGEIAKTTMQRSWSRIGRYNGVRVANVFASVDSDRTNTRAILNDFQADLAPILLEKYPGLKISLKGEAEKGAETGSSMAIAALIGCLGVFVILSFQFHSYIEPLIVMVAIPFALVGVIWGHLFFDMAISLPSVMGYASLSGIVVNDSILLVLFLKSKKEEDKDVKEAAQDASRMRFRAVMITSLTTIAGLMPLLVEKSLQAQILIPIAISICFGLMASTVLILLVLPALYVILSDFGLTSRKKPTVTPPNA